MRRHRVNRVDRLSAFLLLLVYLTFVGGSDNITYSSNSSDSQVKQTINDNQGEPVEAKNIVLPSTESSQLAITLSAKNHLEESNPAPINNPLSLNSINQLNESISGAIPTSRVQETEQTMGNLLPEMSQSLHIKHDSMLESEANSKTVVDSLALIPPVVSLVSSTSQVKTVTKPKGPSPEHQFIQECGCRRILFYGSNEPTNERLNSSCSDEGTHYEAGQKVVSYSIPRVTSPRDFNQSTIYKANIIENLHRMRRFYPGYSMRIYTDLSLDSTYCLFLCQNADLFWCDIRNSFGDQSQMLHSTWKFLPLGDPSVDLFLSRDIATFINERDAAVVQDWLKLNKPFHLMRDSKHRHNVAIMGGLWGARNDLLVGDEGGKLRTQIITMSKTPKNKGYRVKNFDQDILSRVIFYPRRKEIVAYDSYHCKQWKRFTMVRPFPVRRNQTAVESVMKDGASAVGTTVNTKKTKLIKCPVECRPAYGKDWEYC